MTHIVRAEFARLLRRPVLLAAAAAAALFAVVASTAVFLAAEPVGAPTAGRGISEATLTDAGGGTRALAVGVSFTGLLVLVVFVARFTGESSRGTLRTLLLREPRRIRLLAGMMAALLGFTALTLLVAGALTWVASLVVASLRGVPTGAWFTAEAPAAALGDYGRALLVVSAWALLGAALGTVIRATPVALAVGVAWAGPFEHITADAWSGAARWFPGLLLEAVAMGGTTEVTMDRALVPALAYVVVAAIAAAAVLRRRDVAG